MATGRDRARKQVSRAGGRPGSRAQDGDKLFGKVLALALKMLAARSLSEAQLRERLLAKAWADAETVDQCIARLKELGYVNDALFAHSYATYRVNTKAVGRARLARELMGKKVAREAVDDALDRVFEEAGEEALIDRAIRKRIRTHGQIVDRPSAKRMFAHLVRLGFEYDLVIRKLRALRVMIEETANDE